MKKYYIILLLILIEAISISAQDNTVYALKYATQLSECNAIGVPKVPERVVFPEKGWLFKIERQIDDNYIIYFVKWKDNYNSTAIFMSQNKSTLNSKQNTSNSIKNNLYAFNTDNTKKYYLISKAKFVELGMVKFTTNKTTFNFGTILVPIKIRFGSQPVDGIKDRYFDFTGDINLGLSAGLKWRPSNNPDFYINILSGFSITSIPVDSLTTNGYVSTSTKASAFTPSLSLVFEVNDFQIGFFSGIDYLARELGDNWDYKNHPWFGIGFGYSILKPSTRPSDREQNQ